MINKPKISVIHIAERYSDNSGTEWGVLMDVPIGEITIEAQGDKCSFPIEKLEWFAAALERIKFELNNQEMSKYVINTTHCGHHDEYWDGCELCRAIKNDFKLPPLSTIK